MGGPTNAGQDESHSCPQAILSGVRSLTCCITAGDQEGEPSSSVFAYPICTNRPSFPEITVPDQIWERLVGDDHGVHDLVVQTLPFAIP